MPVWYDEVLPVNPVRQLLARTDLIAHLDAQEDDWDDAVLDAKLAAAQGYVEGPDGLTGQYWTPEVLDVRWYGPATFAELYLPGGPWDVDYGFATTLVEAGVSTEIAPNPVPYKRDRRWRLLLSQAVDVDAGAYLNTRLQADPTVPAPVREAILKLAAVMVVDRAAASRRDVGEGIDFAEIRGLVQPWSVGRPR